MKNPAGRFGRRFDANRPSAARRGYGRRWQRIRQRKLKANPLCQHCLADGRGPVPANEVDHIIPSQGIDDPNHWDEDNLQSLCKPCHSRKTLSDMRAGLTR
ncbi:HNH endonuclease [Crateriforma conspicua]|uniref:Putative HNH nuclease YajD n=2 Tax=Crateriforma conspicua TaxID=2527996 RepID=A0A5C6FXS3_9PLAN|nr:HNH endonuclease [Crateriforma conspicua]